MAGTAPVHGCVVSMALPDTTVLLSGGVAELGQQQAGVPHGQHVPPQRGGPGPRQQLAAVTAEAVSARMANIEP